MNKVIATTLLAMFPLIAQADLRIFACEPEWASLAAEIGGQQVTTTTATTAYQDPHYIQARPSLIAAMRRADLVFCSGAQLEIGWLPVLQQKANNRKVMPGSNGYLEASSFVQRFDATSNVDRSQGDIHPQGNPHVQTDPRNIAIIARALAERMAELDTAHADDYAARYLSFSEKWRAAIASWEQSAAPLRGRRIITHHKSWVYLERWLGLEEVANLEPIPGLPPTVSHLSDLASRFKDGGADFIVRSTYQDDKSSVWLHERSGIPAVMLPLTVGGSDDATDLFMLFDDIIKRLRGALRE